MFSVIFMSFQRLTNAIFYKVRIFMISKMATFHENENVHNFLIFCSWGLIFGILSHIQPYFWKLFENYQKFKYNMFLGGGAYMPPPPPQHVSPNRPPQIGLNTETKI